MALALNDRVQQSGTANTTVSFTLSGTVTGYQTFAVIGNGNTTFYAATDTSGNWEVGLGTYSTTGPTLTRTTIYSSSNSGAAVTFSGTVTVYVTYPSERSVNLDASGNVTALGTIASGTWQATTIGTSYGGTGVTTSSGASSNVLRDANSNVTANNFLAGYNVITAAAGTTVLTAASAYYQRISGSTTQTIQLPVATTMANGQGFTFDNDSSGLVTIVDNASTVIDTIPSGGYGYIFVEDNTTSAGSWGKYALLPATYDFSITSANFGGAVLSNGTWNGTTIATGYGGTGLTAFTSGGAVYASSTSALTTGTLPAASGGTGLTSFTANGIVYASSTSALATGSGLTFDGTNLGLNATPTPYGTNYRTFALNGVSGTQIDFQVGGTVKNYIYGSSATFQYDSVSNHVWSLSASEQMRLTSTGLGIGTSSPSNKLSIGGRLDFVSYSTHQDNWGIWANSTDGLTLSSYSVYPMVFRIGNAEKMRLDSSGNLGLGVTPSAWATLKALQFGGGAISGYAGGATNNQVHLLNNAYYGAGGWTYIASDTAQRFTTVNGQFAWYTAPSGTAGNAITFTQAMTLDASGNLLVGATTNSGSLKIMASDGTVQAGFLPYAAGSIAYTGTWTNHSFGFAVNGSEKARIDTSGNFQISSGNIGLTTLKSWSGVKALQLNTGSSIYGVVQAIPETHISTNTYFDGTNYKAVAAGTAADYYQYGDTHNFRVASSVAAGANQSFTYMAIIDSNGLTLNNSFTSGTNSATALYCNGNGKFIQSGADSPVLAVNNNNAYYGMYLNYNGGTGGYGYRSAFTAAAPNSTSYQFFGGSDTGATRFIVYSNGGIANYQANNVNLSDSREKTNVVDGGNYLRKICKVKIRRYRYIDQPETDQATTLGAFAQDFLEEMPEMVTEENWAKDTINDEPKIRYSLYETDIKYALMRSIQEQQEIIDAQQLQIDALLQRFAALEAKVG